jgi:hypothetical protein
MTVEIIDVEQRSPEWFAARTGIPTASCFADVLAKGEGKVRRAYMLKLAGEIVSGEPMENFQSAAMIRGTEQEDEARELYAFLTDEPLTRVGFVRNGNVGCSPDSLVGDRGILEIKSAAAHVLVEKILKGGFPPEHRAQCQGALWVCERDWIDIAIYNPRMTLFTSRAWRDETYIRDLARAVDVFNDELAAIVEQVRRYGAPSALRADLAASLVPA